MDAERVNSIRERRADESFPPGRLWTDGEIDTLVAAYDDALEYAGAQQAEADALRAERDAAHGWTGANRKAALRFLAERDAAVAEVERLRGIIATAVDLTGVDYEAVYDLKSDLRDVLADTPLGATPEPEESSRD